MYPGSPGYWSPWPLWAAALDGSATPVTVHPEIARPSARRASVLIVTRSAQKNWMWLMNPISAASGRFVWAFGRMKYWKSGAKVTPRYTWML